jgi:hypothetical protein
VALGCEHGQIGPDRSSDGSVYKPHATGSTFSDRVLYGALLHFAEAIRYARQDVWSEPATKTTHGALQEVADEAFQHAEVGDNSILERVHHVYGAGGSPLNLVCCGSNREDFISELSTPHDELGGLIEH